MSLLTDLNTPIMISVYLKRDTHDTRPSTGQTFPRVNNFY